MATRIIIKSFAAKYLVEASYGMKCFLCVYAIQKRTVTALKELCAKTCALICYKFAFVKENSFIGEWKRRKEIILQTNLFVKNFQRY